MQLITTRNKEISIPELKEAISSGNGLEVIRPFDKLAIELKNGERVSTLALVGLCLALVSFASLFEFRLLLFSTIGTMLTNITARFRDIIASLVCVKLPTTVYAMNNVLFHGMSNSLLFFGHADL